MWLGKGLWQVYMHNWTVHENVDFCKISTRYPAGQGIFCITFDPELRNERFTMISFMEFPAILSTLQPSALLIENRVI